MNDLTENVKLVFDRVSKTFRRGDDHGSMRDAIPALVQMLLRRGPVVDARSFHSLRDISFEVRGGECVGIIGPNGAGKSTLLKCASRILRPNDGTVAVQGRVSALIEVGAGFHPDLTGRENIFLNGSILGMKRREIAKRLDAIIDFAGIREAIDTPAKRYSSGMFARLGFAVAVFMEPDVLLIDEVLSVGDRAFALQCERKIAEIQASNAAVLFVSHNLAAVRSVCDRVIVLAGGRIAFNGPPEEAIRYYQEWLVGLDDGEGSESAIASCRLHAVSTELDDGAYRPGDVVEIELELRPRDYILDGRVELSLRDSHDTLVYQMASPGSTLPDGQTTKLTFRMILNLLPGTYWIGLAVYGRREATLRPEMLEWRPNRLPLSVDGTDRASGTANLFGNCRMSRARGSSLPTTRV